MARDLREVWIFRLMVLARSGEEQMLFFRLDDEGILARCREFLTVGRQLFVECEALRVPVERSSVHVTDHITFHVRGLEIPGRKKAEDSTAKSAESAEKKETAAA